MITIPTIEPPVSGHEDHEPVPQKWTRAEILTLLASNDKAVGKALTALLKRQTQAEKASHATIEANGRGFNAFDADIMTSMAEFYAKTGYLTSRQLRWLRGTTAKTKVSRIGKYAGQLAEIANQKSGVA